MCYAIPGKIVNLNNKIAIVDYFGEKRNVLNEFENIKIGDYVYAQGGIIIDKIPEKDALEILNFWKEYFFELKKIDQKLSQQRVSQNVNTEVLQILQKVNLNQQLGKDELLKLLQISTTDTNSLNLIYTSANNVRQKELDNACCVHGIIEFSNYCKNNCFYCGIRKDRSILRYRMLPNEIIKTAEIAVKKFGFKAIVLQSGEDFWYNDENLVSIVKEIRKFNILIFLSIGVRSLETYQKLYNAGARAVLIRFETSNKNIFAKLRPQTNFQERIELIKSLKKLGYIIATGFLIGLPNETYEDIINNILLTKSFEPDMYSFGPLIPAIGTPLENVKTIDETTVLKIISITRFVDRQSKILITSSFETLSKEAKRNGLLSGGNSLMINVTPKNYAKLYEIYSNRPNIEKTIEENIKNTIELLYSLGRAPTDLGI